uniref:Telomere-associated protein RIF1 n=1 Tax=Aegilops tauschii TaxID=37682 RepID=M8B314_AEGTA
MAPPSVSRQVAEIAAEPDRAAAYACLLHLQRACADDPSAAADLAAASPSALLPLLLRDAAEDDEAVAASALKCLGFALYHPVLVSTISGQLAQSVLATLVRLIMTTKMKAICNLAVWCISVQQLEASVVEDGVTPLLNAIVYALDNPFGSLSTTFEAVQATMKLASQYPKGMRDQSSIWVPPIYRRLLSADKPERDMSERCLIKVSSVILPPQSPLSKEVALDLEQKLLSSMLDMLNDPSKKIQAVKSWGWFISLLGASAASTRPLLNKMLKVIWKNLVDAFFGPQVLENMDQGTVMSPIEPRAHASAQMKKIRLIMMPLCGVLSRSHNIALSSSCLSTWHYLLYKLGDLINHLSILEAAFGPVLKIIFSTRFDNQNKPLWSFCINLFHDFISVRARHLISPDDDVRVPLNQNLLSQTCAHLKALFDVHQIKWLPWDVTSFDFQLEILGSIVNPELLHNMTADMAVTVMDSTTQTFRLLLEGVQVQCNSKFADDNVMICITKVCKFVKKVFLDTVGKQKSNSSAVLVQFCLKFVKCTVEELDNSLLASGKYELCVDIERIKEIEYAKCSPKLSHPRIRPLAYMELVSPAVYLTALSLSIVAQFTGELSHGDAEQLASIICPPDLLENFHAVVPFLYMQIMRPVDSRLRIKWLVVWNKVSKRLNEQMISYLKAGCGASGHDVLCQFFCYPFFALVSSGSISAHWNAENRFEGYLNMTQDLEAELVIEVYRSFCTNSSYCSEPVYMVFLEHFFEYLINIVDENMSSIQANLKYCLENKSKNITILSVLGNVVIGLLENAQIFNYANKEREVTTNEDPAGCREPNLFLGSLKLANRFMKLSGLAFKENPAAQHQVTSRYFSSLSDFIGHLTSTKDVLLLFEIIGDQFTEWLTLSSTLYCIIRQGETIDQLEKLWLNSVTHLTANRLISDCSFLEKHRLLLQAAINHPHSPISAATTAIQRSPGSSNAGLRHAGRRSVSKADELFLDRPGKDPNCASNAERAFALEEFNISRMSVAPVVSGRGTVRSSTTDRRQSNGESLRVSAGLGRKRLKIMRYSGNGKGLGKVTDASFSPGWAEGEVCRKPELILEMLKRKR